MRALADLHPGSIHVRDAGLAAALDAVVWSYAAKHGLAIVSKDADFHQLAFTSGPPPKVVWIRLGNCTTDDIAGVIRGHQVEIRAFSEDPEAAFLALG